ncbi:MAG: VWA domain-containing protein [Burkholderiales bacterium]|nr:VWA domain-containing protein [Burkholderiales bacterium]
MAQAARPAFALTNRDGPPPVLQGVQVSARLEGVTFALCLRQTYCNMSERDLELVYTFPLPADAVLLGLAAELGDKRMEGIVLARRQAEHQYEDGLAEGDTPVLLEPLGQGLFSANIGNLQPGEKIVLELRFAQWLRFDQGHLRLHVPTTIAPRHGNAAAAGLQAQQVPDVSAAIVIPLAVTIDVAGALAQATIECPTHALRRQPRDSALRLVLEQEAWLDRDLVLLLTPVDPLQPLLAQAADATDTASAPLRVMSLPLPAGPPRRHAMHLRLLLDRSGSMAGDSLASAKRALFAAIDTLDVADTVSLCSFGSTVERHLAPAAASPQLLQQLHGHIAALQANLGGTLLHAALISLLPLEISARHEEVPPTDLLVITDGGTWLPDLLVDQVRACGCRVFAVGVGAAPAEGVMRVLTEQTGGTFELATPGEHLEAAARRVVQRVRQHTWRGLRVDWGMPVQWQHLSSTQLCGGDMLTAVAGVFAPEDATAAPVMSVTALGPEGQRQTLTTLPQPEWPVIAEADATLARLAAAGRIRDSKAESAPGRALALALRYQLLTEDTCCVLIHRRAAVDKAREAGELHRVQSMLAAGWSGMGTVKPGPIDVIENQMVGECFRGHHALRNVPMAAEAPDALDGRSPADVQSAGAQIGGDPAPPWVAPLALILEFAGNILSVDAASDEIVAQLRALPPPPVVVDAIAKAMSLGLSERQAWLALLVWGWRCDDATPRHDTCAALEVQAKAIDVLLFEKAMSLMQDLLGDYAMEAWISRREQRLLNAMSAGTDA